MTGVHRRLMSSLAAAVAIAFSISGSAAWAGPAVASGPATVAGSATVAARTGGTLHWSRPVLLDPQRSLTISAVSCADQTFCDAVAGYSVLTYNGKAWSKPKEVVSPDTVRSGLDAISCPTASFCAATGFSLTGGRSVRGDYAVVWDHSRWSAPVRLSTAADGGASVSCASASFCLAVTKSGTAFQFDGSSWSAGTGLQTGGLTMLSVSCPTPAFCAAVGDDALVATYADGTWSTPVSVSSGVSHSELTSVSCASADMCVAVGGEPGTAAAYYTTYNGSVWINLVGIDQNTGGGLAAVSCPTAGFCLGLDTIGQSWQFGGESWQFQLSLGTGLTTGSLSCVSASFCMASAALGTVQELQAYATGGWQPPAVVAYPTGPLVAASCPAAGLCTVVDEEGNAYRFSQGTWHWSSGLSRKTGGRIENLSCPTTSFCLATGDYLDTYSWASGKWTASQQFNGIAVGPPGTMSCASPSFCAAVDDYGVASIWRGKTWTQPRAVGSLQYGLSAVTCPASGFCAAGGDSSAEFTFSDRSWAAPLLLGRARAGSGSLSTITGMSCATRTFCVAVDGSGYAITFNANARSAARPVRLGKAGLLAVSCPVAGFCVAVGAKGGIFALSSGRWQKTESIGADQVLDSVSCASARFCVAVTKSGYVVVGR
jgi:hypothetical protein